MPDLPILFTDAEALVIDKPSGLPVDRPKDGTPALADMVDDLRFGFARPPGIVHRLDRDTSGCLLLARNHGAHRRFSAAFANHEVQKTYLAVLEGVPAEDEGVIELALSKISSAAGGWRIIPAKKGKPAVTHWTRLAVRDGRALVRFEPKTGRTHQLRVHAASGLGLPIVGDPTYGDGRVAMLLHASRIVMPRHNKPAIDVEAPLPARFGSWQLGQG
ncbi:RNA pseudouridine synthase [Sphingomonas sp. ID1715]|uniref:RluA family pseudouridine synthase n=1 Tax=Sphingomonas sp. ID1715 TaxID=1656898 RepID=UPI001489AE93|nr:RNA pseudouridine synthase [Sphingomonas sp. ID1715]